ncbi:MAG: hypothetical protein HYW47_01845 [Deltaproteobacteria bacterium]|nr:hypothetical protein [Deltaproteobacteria bacterium]
MWHSAQAKSPQEAGKALEFGYDEHFYIKRADGLFSFQLKWLLQPRYEYRHTEGGAANVNTFTLNSETYYEGNVLYPKLDYYISYTMAATSGGLVAGIDRATFDLRDAWINWKPEKYFNLKIGQFFLFFDHEDMQRTWFLQLVDRSIISTNLGFERELGINLQGWIFNDLIFYNAHVMNGEGRHQSNANTSFLVGGRLDFSLLGKHYAIVPDFMHSQKPQLNIGVAGLNSRNNSVNGNTLYHLTSDVGFRYLGFSFLGLANGVHNKNKRKTDFGYMIQCGYFFIPRYLEVAARYAKVNKDAALGTATYDPEEATLGISYYFQAAPHLVWKFEVSRLWNNGASHQNDYRSRTQLSMFF